MSLESPSKVQLWAGRALSALPVLALVLSGAMKLSHSPEIVANFGKFGFAESTLTPIGVVELLAAVLYAVPQTAIFGAVLVTAYLGGATATHVRASDPFFAPVILGVLVWIGLWLREPRLRALTPLRKLDSTK